MSCDEVRDSYELYALGVLDDPEREEIQAHIARRCASCTAGLKKALEMSAHIAALVPSVEPPARLRKRVLASVGAPQSAWSWNVVWTAVAAALFAGVLWLSIQDRRLNSQLVEARGELSEAEARLRAMDADLSKVREALAFLSEPGTQVLVAGGTVPLPPRGRAFINRASGVLLIADRLPPTGAGKIYEMWVIPKGGAPRPAGLFQSDASGNAVHLHRTTVEPGSVVAVTVEPEAGSAAPTSTPIFVVGM